ncbi:dipeptidase [Alkalicoccus saliphilus]|nr:dipeptidase [Alkalicoccus saliphilus]
MMHIIDLHCDALLKLQEDKSRDFFSPELEVNSSRLAEGKVKLQFFAVFLEPDYTPEEKFARAIDQIDLFYEKVVKADSRIRHITSWSQVDDLKHDETGAVLTLEGAEAFGDDLGKLRTLYRLGVMSIGLTWNNANLCADGIGESRGAGLTDFGREVVALNNKHKVLTDVTHLSVKGFWDVLKLAAYPIATHSNAISICGHRRNLDDEQLKALFKAGGIAGLVYNPPFIGENEKGSLISELLKHAEHLIKLGGENQIALGSDFDGIPTHVHGLSHAGEHPRFASALKDKFGEETARKITSGNAAAFFREIE